MRTISPRRNHAVLGAVSLILATLLFAAVFTYLAITFDYPDVLDRPASDVLPALTGLGTSGRAVWLLYGLIPLLLIPTGFGVKEATRHEAPHLGRLAMWLACASAVAMTIGLLRWPTLHWSLAQQWAAAAAVAREAIAARFDTANLYLGNVIGEFVGELFLNGFFVVSAFAVSAAYGGRRWLALAGIAVGLIGWVAMLRNLTPLVTPVAEFNNIVLPLWMLVFGVTLLLTQTPGRASRHQAHVSV